MPRRSDRSSATSRGRRVQPDATTFDDEILWELIARESKARRVPVNALLRRTLLAINAGQLSVDLEDGARLPGWQGALHTAAFWAEHPLLDERGLTSFWGWLKLLRSSRRGYTRWLDQAIKPRPRGPAKGKLRRYADADRALFPEIELLMREEKLSLAAATRRLAEAGKVDGMGSSDSASRAKRLARLYVGERHNAQRE